ncbi:dihydroxyacetone kinase family protein [Luteimicrobium subarcticum]|uniref:Homodimeric dihydroxyacetone kinase n=1 Tax=Luteimicrobium subarcticum TaxID=620910 RepID=A0A2M8WVW2_9MICO|nr:dihydroxyacetone kinase family protein [Luteimicrobium subarcticum]PJI95062.1 homodimeric dihydroxyacetone kinase [Luteimicrobium subarcticum]
MTTVFNDPSQFADEMIAGFTSLHPELVEPVYGGVVRSTETPENKVAVVIGGGSGHYPAFAGWVGPGMADGAVVGNVFASPSTQQVYSVARAAQRGGGVFLSYGNYAGDVLNFDLAQERLRSEGIPTQTVTVTDDLTSASSDEAHKRRGTAGDLVVFKIAGAAAEAGYDLDAVTDVARRANARTFSFAVAFAGCTLPGAPEPLFTVPTGRMGVGMGVHGEPGISEEDVVTSRELAELLVNTVLEERPDGVDGRVLATVNGLGGTKYEELFVLWNDIRPLLEAAGTQLVAPQVGEFITSLDMAGLSLTLTWLDDELEQLWLAPAETPAFRIGGGLHAAQKTEHAASQTGARIFAVASAESQDAARTLLSYAERVAGALRESEDDLGKLDSVAGDGDHGRGMTKGSLAAVAALREAVTQGAGVASALADAGDAWGDKAGGTSGALWGAALRAAAGTLDDEVAPTADAVADAVQAGLDELLAFGKAHVGDKTMLDALVPFVESLRTRLDAGDGAADAWHVAAGVATQKAADTASLTPQIGRARPLAERSLGYADPGATSLALVVATVAAEAGE